MKLHYYESILNFYCDSLTEEELLEKIREWTLRYRRPPLRFPPPGRKPQQYQLYL